MSNIQFTGCDLHIPHKQWSGNPQEENNLATIEQWANNFRKNCLPGGGSTTVHRVHYDMRNWTHSGTHSSVPSGQEVFGGNENQQADWSNSSYGPTEAIADEVFVPDLTSDPTISLLRVTNAGMLSWSGHFWIQIYAPVAAYSGGKYDFFDDNSDHDGGWNQEETWTAIPDVSGHFLLTLALGGSAYIPADTWLEFAIRQNMGNGGGTAGPGGAYLGMTLTLLEF